MDDTHTMLVSLTLEAAAGAIAPRSATAGVLPGAKLGNATLLPNTTDWYGRWRLAATRRTTG